MGNLNTNFNTLTRSRAGGFFLPREHGAWGMLLVPIVTGAAAGSPHGERLIWTLLFAAAALGLFCLRTPLEAGLGISALRPQNDRERKLVYYLIYLYACVACLPLAVLMLWARAYGLLLLGAAAAIAFLLLLGTEATGPAQPDECPVDRRHCSQFNFRRSLLPGHRSLGIDRCHALAGELAFRRQPNSFCSTAHSYPRAVAQSRNSARAGISFFIKPPAFFFGPHLARRRLPQSDADGVRAAVCPGLCVVPGAGPAASGASTGLESYCMQSYSDYRPSPVITKVW